MYTNVINTAFDGVAHVSDGIALLEVRSLATTRRVRSGWLNHDESPPYASSRAARDLLLACEARRNQALRREEDGRHLPALHPPGKLVVAWRVLFVSPVLDHYE